LQNAEKSAPIDDESNSGTVTETVTETVALADSPATILDDDSESSWYVRPPSGGQYGPATTELLKKWIEEGRVAATALLWREGWPQWRDASEALPELIAKLPENDASSSPASAPISNSRQPAVASAKPIEVEPTPLTGKADIGTNRRKQSHRRIYLIGVLTVLVVTLIVALFIVANR